MAKESKNRDEKKSRFEEVTDIGLSYIVVCSALLMVFLGMSVPQFVIVGFFIGMTWAFGLKKLRRQIKLRRK